MSNPTNKPNIATSDFTDLKRKYPAEAYTTINTLSNGFTFYTGEMIGLDSSGNVGHMDDAQRWVFAGIMNDVLPLTVASGDAAGGTNLNPNRITVDRPAYFMVKIAAAAAGDEGKKVYSKFSDEVQYTCGTYANEVGEVLQVIDSTHVLVAPPWCPLRYRGSSLRGVISGNAASATTLTSLDCGKVVLLPLTSSETINLPAIATCSPGDKILFVNTSSNSSTPTLDPNGADTINGGSTFTMSTVQYATCEVVYDGTEWVVNVPSLTIGGTNFTGAVTIASTSATSFAVGRNGSTNPGLLVDDSTSSAATGIKVKPAAAASGVAISVITSGTNESATIDAAGTGSLKLNSVGGTGAVQIGGAASGNNATGITVTPNAAASGVAVAVVSTGTDENITLDAKGAGTITLNATATGNVVLGRGIVPGAAVSPTAFAASSDNLAIGNVFHVRVTTNNGGAQNFTGMTGGAEGRMVYISNIGSTDSIVIKHDATSTAANRFYAANASDVTLRKLGSVTAVYDGTLARWMVVGA